jgi:hypothetical protein
MEIRCGCFIVGKTDSCEDCGKRQHVEVIPGLQVVYIPMHAWAGGTPMLPHPDVEFGFVTSNNEEFAFVRYFHDPWTWELRTTANSEATSPGDLFALGNRDQDEIEILLKEIDNGDGDAPS